MTSARTVGVVLLLASLSVSQAVSTRSRLAPVATAGAGQGPQARLAPVNGRTGIGVELEVMNLSLEIAWFESLPVSPGRRLVFSWLPSSRGE